MNQKIVSVNEKVVCYLCDEIFAKSEVVVVNGECLCGNCHLNYQEEFNQ